MKYTFTKGLFVAAIATLFAACSTDDAADQAPVAPGKIEVSLNAALPESRAQINVDETNGRFTGAWEATDIMTVLAKGSTSGDEAAQFTYDASSKVFKGQLTDATQDWTYQAVYPYVAAAGAEHKIPFGAARTQKGNNFNGDYDPLVSAPVTHQGSAPGKTPQGEAVTFGLNRLTAILAVTFTTDDASVKSEKVKTVVLTAADGKMIAAKTFDIDKSAQSGALGADEQSDAITLSYEEGSEPTAESFKAYFNVPAANYGKLTATITTEGHTATLDLSDGVELTAGELAYGTRAVTGWTELAPAPAAPTLEWVDHALNPDGTYEKEEITADMIVKVKLQAAAGIKGFVIKIESAALAAILKDAFPPVNNVMTLDMINDPNTAAISSMITGFPETLPNYAELFELDLSTLVPLILSLSDNVGDHLFSLSLTDNQDRTLEKTLPFFIPAPEPTAAFSNVNLWTNSATVTLSNIPADASSVSFAYRKTKTEAWKEVTVENKTTANITVATTDHTTASWTTLNTVLPYSRLDNSTGIFAGQTYDYKITVDGQEFISTAAYKASNAPVDQAIPNGDMEDSNLQCFANNDQNTRDSDFWNSGNNAAFKTGTFNTTILCTQSSFLGSNRAKCQSGFAGAMGIGAFAPGNLFTGKFNYDNYLGTVDFGQKLPWTARPSAMNVSYHATIGKVNRNQGIEAKIANDQDDYARIFVCIVDWSGRHTVASSPNVKFISQISTASLTGSWDPETQKATDEGKIIAYGSLWINPAMNSSADKMDDVTIDLNYYDLSTKPTSGNYSVVISCSGSAYGDYFSGCDKNTLYVDNFEWVY